MLVSHLPALCHEVGNVQTAISLPTTREPSGLATGGRLAFCQLRQRGNRRRVVLDKGNAEAIVGHSRHFAVEVLARSLWHKRVAELD